MKSTGKQRESLMKRESISEQESKRIQEDLFKAKFRSSEYDMLRGFELAKLKMIEMIASAYLNGEFARTWSEKIRNLRMVDLRDKDKDEMEALKAAIRHSRESDEENEI